MGRRGPGALPQAEKREQYARLIAEGYSNSEAAAGTFPKVGGLYRIAKHAARYAKK
jgi:hypothetical protein